MERIYKTATQGVIDIPDIQEDPSIADETLEMNHCAGMCYIQVLEAVRLISQQHPPHRSLQFHRLNIKR